MQYSLCLNSKVYMSGGSGYVLSRESLRRFVESAIVNNTGCDVINDAQPEDWAMGRCLRAVNVTAGDSRDTHGEIRFYPFEAHVVLLATYLQDDFWFFDYSFYNPRACRDCLSKYPVAFHYISPELMYLYEFFAYEFRAHDQPDEPEFALPKKLSPDEVSIKQSDNIWSIVKN
ncbi:PREDICTED: glycoprotein-N-acetylgalactosamine 3-beta-galactosyltransferase 1-like [Rhagoletis zephyria]|uniref:glycoprotein-N-acetylgalactosamine 3-beta-galactosyltransferase 1-like n=1 Tax=Rhagoletis zephyria TaxID=28612 RepID=UPI000811A0CC|nr:PREDICTED: glycoprotein-N-acetylgalactosamine 3-beta-galactosyltransferase 1-like [Rhagoletis zephyria]